MKKETNLSEIELLVLDVDGVLTDGTITVHADGSESKSFNCLDGHGIRMWQRAGLKTAFLSGRTSAPVGIRAKQLEVDWVLQGCHDKLPALKELLQKLGIAAKQTAFIGDDLPDLPVMRYVGLGVAVADAANEVKRHADYVTTKPGGAGAVREVVELILKDRGAWQQLMKRYLPES
jgi:3-deoxy-D-manno-octulosonate 8-phosphate phosphatase (KDO 8-P phosphatase)